MSDKTSDAKINNVGIISYKYTPDPNQSEVIIKSNVSTNIVPLAIESKDVIELKYEKLSAINTVTLGENINYSIQFQNKGNINIGAIVIKDRIDPNSKYVKNSTVLKNFTFTETLGNIVLTEYATEEESRADDIFSDILRAKSAVYTRDGTLATIDALNAKGVNIPEQELYKVNLNVYFDQLNNNLDKLDIQDVNIGYNENLGTDAGRLYKAVNGVYKYIYSTDRSDSEKKIIDSTLTTFNHFFARDALIVSLTLLNNGINDANDTDNNKKDSAVQNVINILINAYNFLMDIRNDNTLSLQRRRYIQKNISDLKSFIVDKFEVYISGNESPFDANDKMKTNLVVDKNNIDYTNNALVIVNKIQELQTIFSYCISQVHYLEIPNIQITSSRIMWILNNLATNLKNTPIYNEQTADGEINYNVREESRCEKVWNSCRNAIAIVTTILPYLYDGTIGKFKDKYSLYVSRLMNEKDRIESVLVRYSTHEAGSDFNEYAILAANALIELYRDIETLNGMITDGELSDDNFTYNSLYEVNVVPYKYMPVNSWTDFMCTLNVCSPSEPQKTGKNEDSPQCVTYPDISLENPTECIKDDVIAEFPTIENSIKEILVESLSATSYVVVPDAARQLMYARNDDCTPNEDRDIIIHFNLELGRDDFGEILLGVLVGGEEIERDKDYNMVSYSVNNKANICTMNSEEIVNKFGVGYKAYKDNIVISEKVVPTKDDFDNNINIKTISNPLKFAYLVASKDIFIDYGDGNGYVTPSEDQGIVCGKNICYLITLKNYGNVDATQCVCQDLLKTGLELLAYTPEYIDNILQGVKSYVLTNLTCFTIKKYDTGYITSNNKVKVNNTVNEEVIKGYPVANEDIGEEARIDGYLRVKRLEIEGAYGILVQNEYLEVRNITVEKRTGTLDVEVYDRDNPQMDNSNDDVLKPVEIRLYYNLKCENAFS